MKIHRLSLQNFRQFRGEQTFDFHSDELSPVSVVFGANGAGKTTLLNAFTWALYGSMSDDVEEQERMVTDGVWRALPYGESAEVSVEVSFDHEGHYFRLRRRAEMRKESDAQPRIAPNLQLWETKKDGSSEEVGAPQEKIYSILPKGVSRFFFFNGERIEKLVQKGAYSEVQQDIKALLNLEQVERAIDHLPKVDRRLTADLRKHGGEQAGAIQSAIDDLREREVSHQDELKVLEGEIAALTEERDSVTELLRQHAGAAPVQKQRDETVQELSEAKKALDSAKADRSSLIAGKGFIAFTISLGDRTQEIANTLYEKGSLPAPLKREFVDQLLEKGECICGAVLTEHSTPWTHVTEWRQRAGLQAVETAWQRLSGQIAPIAAGRLELRESLLAVIQRINSERDRVNRLEERQSELDGLLKDSRLEDVQKLETKRLDLERRIGDRQRQVGSSRDALHRIQTEITQRIADRNRADVTDELAAKARTRSDMVQTVRDALKEILAIRSEDMRNRLDAELKAVFAKISIKPYVPQLSPTFELTLTQNVDGVELPVPKSTGENQILSLSFVAAVSKLAREIRVERQSAETQGDDSGTFPIVMDAAFGSLDSNYQREVAKALAEMAPQLIVLVSKSQGLGNVVGQLMPYVGHLGVIVTHSSARTSVAENIEIEGISHSYIVSDEESDYAELRAIK